MKTKKNTKKRRLTTKHNTRVISSGGKIPQQTKLFSAYAVVLVIAVSLLLLF